MLIFPTIRFSLNALLFKSGFCTLMRILSPVVGYGDRGLSCYNSAVRHHQVGFLGQARWTFAGRGGEESAIATDEERSAPLVPTLSRVG